MTSVTERANGVHLVRPFAVESQTWPCWKSQSKTLLHGTSRDALADLDELAANLTTRAGTILPRSTLVRSSRPLRRCLGDREVA